MSAIAKRILIVDDDRVFVNLMSGTFRDQGFETFNALDGVEGLQLFEENRPSIVLLDVAMPGLNGFQVAEKIRQSEAEGEHTIIIIMTAYARSFSISQEFELSVDSYLTKPMLPSDLVAHVTALMR